MRSNGQNNFLLNGVDNNVNVIDFLNATSFSVGPSVDAISEMTIQTNGYNAEYGRAAGAVINVNIKSGTNALHGRLFEFLQNRDLDANVWTNNLSGIPRRAFEQNQFGGTLGGPIIRNKLFIFGNYQGTTLINASAGLSGLGFSGYQTIPTQAEISGNFSSILGALRDQHRQQRQSRLFPEGRHLRPGVDDRHGHGAGIAHGFSRKHNPGKPHGPHLQQDRLPVPGSQPTPSSPVRSRPTITTSPRRVRRARIRAILASITG